MSRGSRPPTRVPVYSHNRQYLFHASPEEAASLIRRGAVAKRNRQRRLLHIVEAAPKAMPSNSNETPCSIPNRHIRINAGLEEVSAGTERYIRNRVELFDPALSEVRAQCLGIGAEELAKLKEVRLSSLKRAFMRGI